MSNNERKDKFDEYQTWVLKKLEKSLQESNSDYFSSSVQPCAIDLIIHSHISTVIYMGTLLTNKLNDQKYPELALWYNLMNDQYQCREQLEKLYAVLDKKKYFGKYLDAVN